MDCDGINYCVLIIVSLFFSNKEMKSEHFLDLVNCAITLHKLPFLFLTTLHYNLITRE